jgi:hypothetical protein
MYRAVLILKNLRVVIILMEKIRHLL